MVGNENYIVEIISRKKRIVDKKRWLFLCIVSSSQLSLGSSCLYHHPYMCVTIIIINSFIYFYSFRKCIRTSPIQFYHYKSHCRARYSCRSRFYICDNTWFCQKWGWIFWIILDIECTSTTSTSFTDNRSDIIFRETCKSLYQISWKHDGWTRRD